MLVFENLERNTEEMSAQLRTLGAEIRALSNIGLDGIRGGKIIGPEAFELIAVDDRRVFNTNIGYLAGAGWQMAIESRLHNGQVTIMFAKRKLSLYYHMVPDSAGVIADQLFASVLAKETIAA